MKNKYYFNYIDNIDITSFKSLIENFNDEDWDKFDYRQNRYVVHRDTKTVPLIMDIDFRLENPTHYPLYKKIKKHIEFAESKLYKKYGDGYLIRAVFTKLNAGGNISAHTDNYISLELCYRVHIPIITNDGVLFSVGDEVINMKEGEMWEINNQEWHSVINDSNLDRIHLILDWISYKDYENYKREYEN